MMNTNEKITIKVKNYLHSIEKNKNLNAFIRVYEDEALARAEILETIPKEKRGKLHGLVVGIKDMFNYKNHPLQAASKILEGYTAKYNATVVERLLNEGAIIIGHQNCDEFGMGSSNENSVYGPCLNALDEKRVSGGSSGGGAVAIQADMCEISLGTDTGGSTRFPASLCGVIGLKPTYSRISRYGVVAYASSLDCVGIFGKKIELIAKTLEVLAGEDEKDCTSSNLPVESYNNVNSNPIKKLKIGYINNALKFEKIQKEVVTNTEKAITNLKNLGHILSPIDLNQIEHALPTYYVIANAEASSNLSCYDGIRYGYRTENYKNLEEMYKKTRSEGFGNEAKRRIVTGNYILSGGKKYDLLKKAQQVRSMVANEIYALFEEYDFLILPTAPNTAFKIGEIVDPITMYMEDYFTVPFSVAGVPAISVPNGHDKIGMPIGLQIVAAPFKEKELLSFANYFLQI